MKIDHVVTRFFFTTNLPINPQIDSLVVTGLQVGGLPENVSGFPHSQEGFL
jgi:hypothetical protein